VSSVAAAFLSYYGLDSYSSRVLGGMGGCEVVVSKDGLRAEAVSVWASGSFTAVVDDVPVGAIDDGSEFAVALLACAAIGLDIDPPPTLVLPPEDPGPPLRDVEVRHDWIDPYDYVGVAVQGSSVLDPVWRIRRIAPSPDGEAVSTTATGAVWNNREAEVYV